MRRLRRDRQKISLSPVFFSGAPETEQNKGNSPTHVVNYSSNTSHTHINDGSGVGHYDPYSWGDDWVWCAVLAGIGILFFVFFLIFLLVPYNSCYGGRCLYYNGTTYYAYPIEEEESARGDGHVAHYKDEYTLNQIREERRFQRMVTTALEEKQQDCQRGMHAWLPEKLVAKKSDVSVADATCVVNYYTPSGFDPEILPQDQDEAHEKACSPFDFESFVCDGWYNGDGPHSSNETAIKRFFERTVSLFSVHGFKTITGLLSGEGLLDHQTSFRRSRGFSQLSHMNQELLKDVISQLAVYTPTGWFDKDSLDKVTGQVGKTQFRRLISSCVKSLETDTRVLPRNDPNEVPLQQPHDMELFFDAVHSVVAPIRMAEEKRDSGDNVEWDVGRAFGRAQCIGVSPVVDVRANSYFYDRTKAVLMADIQMPLADDVTSVLDMYCSVVQTLPWRTAGDKQRCLDTISRISEAYRSFVGDVNKDNDQLSAQIEAFFSSQFWLGYVQGMTESTMTNDKPCLDVNAAQELLNSQIHTTPTSHFPDADKAFAFYAMAFAQNDDNTKDIVRVEDYVETWGIYLEAALAADYVEYVDYERLEATVSPVFQSMYGYDMYTGRHPMHNVHKEHFGASELKEKTKEEQIEREWKAHLKRSNTPWQRGHKHALKDTMNEIQKREETQSPAWEDMAHLKGWVSRVQQRSHISSRGATRGSLQQQHQRAHMIRPERGTLEAEMDSDKWQVCTEVAAAYLPSVVDDAFASTAITRKDIDMISDVINRVIEQIIHSIQKSSVLSQNAKEKLVKKARMITIRVATPWISRQNIHIENEEDNLSTGVLAPPDHEEMNIGGVSLWRDVSAIRSYAIGNNLNAAFGPVASEKERRDKMAFHSGGLPHFGMPTSAVNAYYSPVQNSINILAGIMGAPFHHKDYTMASRLATIGAVVGHEIAHGFDSSGIHFDSMGSFAFATGNPNRKSGWLFVDDMNAYVSREQCFIDKYTTTTRLGNVNDGENTLGENIADTMGTRAALEALTAWNRDQHPQQEYPPSRMMREFLQAYGQMWCSSQTKEQEQHRIDTDVHSPGGTRINGAISSLYFSTGSDPLYIAYGCRRDHHLGVSPELQQKAKPCTLW